MAAHSLNSVFMSHPYERCAMVSMPAHLFYLFTPQSGRPPAGGAATHKETVVKLPGPHLKSLQCHSGQKWKVILNHLENEFLILRSSRETEVKHILPELKRQKTHTRSKLQLQLEESIETFSDEQNLTEAGLCHFTRCVPKMFCIYFLHLI
ncbi:hypothetical protein E3U43_021836 [Larimichthys crocea]|uniref:Uncharacterized protein n=1 Tax=Larimichthys crocea TaxID=215358 RepID=A0ACD3R7E8_LARCR|nr:hypothetical protein E3U43_021836 [Larimichthys crocea]